MHLFKYHGTLIYGNQFVSARRQDQCCDCSVIWTISIGCLFWTLPPLWTWVTGFRHHYGDSGTVSPARLCHCCHRICLVTQGQQSNLSQACHYGQTNCHPPLWQYSVLLRPYGFWLGTKFRKQPFIALVFFLKRWSHQIWWLQCEGRIENLVHVFSTIISSAESWCFRFDKIKLMALFALSLDGYKQWFTTQWEQHNGNAD